MTVPPSFSPDVATARREVVAFRPDDPADVPTSARPAPQPGGPNVGDWFGEFVLLERLGSGGFGTVFLAAQRDLADRPVALKITSADSDESDKLARLQHTAIMPVHSTHRVGHLRAVCMPYLGRTTLADVCRSLRPERGMPGSGDHLRSTIEGLRASTRPKSGPVTPHGLPLMPEAADPIAALSMLSYVDAVLLTVLRIAEGLEHAHRRGIVHLDLKPANVLVTDEGQPMILDFNLARLASPAGHAADAAGGTVPYMSPEQLRRSAGDGAAVIDARSDLYSLGLVAYRLLTGSMPFGEPGPHEDRVSGTLRLRGFAPPPMRRRNPGVTPAAEAVVRKCLAFDPAARYASAADLAEDLRRHLDHLPLRHAPNSSIRERAAKWVRRNPAWTSWPVLASLAAVAAAGIVAVAARAGAEAKARAVEAEYRAAREAERSFEEDRALAEQYLSSSGDEEGWRRRGVELGFRALGESGAADGRLDARFAPLPEADRDRVRKSAEDLALLLVRSTANGSHVPDGARAKLVAMLDATDAAGLTRGGADRKAFLEAADLQSKGRFRESLIKLEAYTRDHPAESSGWFLRGRAHDRLGENAESYRAYSVCVALKPTFPPGYFHRAMAADRQLNGVGALEDLDAAIRLEPALVEARLRRAIILRRLKRLAEARAEADRLIELPGAPPRAWALRADIRAAAGDAAGADRDRRHFLAMKTDDAMSLVVRGLVKLDAKDDGGAMDDFRAAEKLAPDAIEPLQNQANVLADVRNDPAAAIKVLDRLLAQHPQSLEALCGRSVYLARAGQRKEAVRDAEAALRLSDVPFTQYRAACVYALLSAKSPDYRAKALDLLSRALEFGEGHAYVLDDADLDPLRKDAAFDSLVGYVRALKSARLPAPNPADRKNP